jgi:hypothetical protein
MVDVNGIHGLGCRISTGRLTRHNAINELIKRVLLTAEIPSRLEPAKLSHTDDINDQTACQQCLGHVDSVYSVGLHVS